MTLGAAGGPMISKDGKEGTDLIDEALRYNGTLPVQSTPDAPTQRSTPKTPAADPKTRKETSGAAPTASTPAPSPAVIKP